MTLPNHPRITIDPERIFGKPSIRDLRFTVSDVLDYLAAGMSEDELGGFPLFGAGRYQGRLAVCGRP